MGRLNRDWLIWFQRHRNSEVLAQPNFLLEVISIIGRIKIRMYLNGLSMTALRTDKLRIG